MMLKTAIKIYRPEGVNFFDEDCQIVKIASGFKFAESPLWHPDGYLLISDIPQNRIFQLYLNGVIYVHTYNSGGSCIFLNYLSDMIGSNGLALNNKQNLVFCQHGNHGIAIIDKAKNTTNLCCSFNNKPFNSPNDLVIKSDGAIFFTDPPYGLKNNVLNPEIFQPHSGLYRFFDNKVTLLSTDLQYPNGLCFSADEKFLFVSSNHPDEKLIYKYELSAYGEIIHKSIFATVNADGIAADKNNFVYAATAEGVLILSPEGQKMAVIAFDSIVTNITFGGKDNSLLFITTPSAVYYVPYNYDPTRYVAYNPFDKSVKAVLNQPVKRIKTGKEMVRAKITH